MAADPVSPLVAPKITIFFPNFSEAAFRNLPKSCMATSLNASVGPWNNSKTCPNS